MTETEPKILLKAALLAAFLECAFVVLAGLGLHARPAFRPIDESRFVEADMIEVPKEIPKLIAEPSARAVPVRPEATLSKVPDQGKAHPSPAPLAESNRTEAGPKLLPTHGPVVFDSPSPSIPEYLRNQDLKTSVVIEFLIAASGSVTPRLMSSSGNEELDQIALSTAKRWRFYPAESNHSAIDSKIKLRIVFEVH